MLVGRRLERALERGGGGIVDRTDEAGDVARGGRLAPALLDAAARLALEIDDEDVVLDDQDLTEVEIAVMANLRASISRAATARIVRADARSASSASASRRSPPSSSARRAPIVERPLGASADALGPAAHVVGRDRLGREAGIVRGSQRELQFGHAPPDLRMRMQIGRLLVAFAPRASSVSRRCSSTKRSR